MCKFQINKIYNNKANKTLKAQIEKIATGSVIFVKWYNAKTHKIQYTSGVLLAKRWKGTSSHIVIRKRVTKEVITFIFYLFAKTFLGIGILKEERYNLTAKKYGLLLRPLKWKYL